MTEKELHSWACQYEDRGLLGRQWKDRDWGMKNKSGNRRLPSNIAGSLLQNPSWAPAQHLRNNRVREGNWKNRNPDRSMSFSINELKLLTSQKARGKGCLSLDLTAIPGLQHQKQRQRCRQTGLKGACGKAVPTVNGNPEWESLKHHLLGKGLILRLYTKVPAAEETCSASSSRRENFVVLKWGVTAP